MFKKILCYTAIVLLPILITGCVSFSQMPFSEKSYTLTPETPPVFLLTATFKNTARSRFQPEARTMTLQKMNAAQGEKNAVFYRVDKLGANEAYTMEEGNSYLLRMELVEGQYVLRHFSGSARSFPIQAIFIAPIHAPIQAKVKGVFYLGHIEASIRERKDDEFRAGPVVPLIDQAAAGLSGGTWDIEITDRYDADVAAFRKQFPGLSDVNITKQILPKFDRALAQKIWSGE